MFDRKILQQLDQNSRQAYSKMAKKIRATKQVVKYRMEKMIERQIISGFYTVIDYSKLGFLMFRLYFKVSKMPLQKKQELISFLKNHKKIAIFYRITGHYDFSFSIWVRDVWDYENFWDEFNEKFGGCLLDCHLAIKTKYTEFSRNYLLEGETEKTEFTVSKKSAIEELDETDFKILTILSTNARTSLVELSKQTKVSIVTCRTKIKELIKKKVILGFRAIIDCEKLGYTYYKVDLWFRDNAKKKELANHILSNPNVIYTEKTVLTSDLEFDLEVRNFEKFIKIMDDFEKDYPDSIDHYEYYTRIKNYKVNYLPAI